MIEIYNQTKQKINKKLIEKFVQEIFKKIKSSKPPLSRRLEEKMEISIVFVGEKKIKQLNKEYRKINKVTDVLSFGLWKCDNQENTKTQKHENTKTKKQKNKKTKKQKNTKTKKQKNTKTQKQKNKKTRNNFGEIFICFQKIKKQAKIFKHSASQELKIILIHGILHLLGYDHETKKDWEEMREMEKEIINYKSIK